MFIKQYYDVSISRCGIRNDIVCDKHWGVHFKLDPDTRRLFPYINKLVPKAQYSAQPLFIKFILKDIVCMLYPNEVIASAFSGRDHAYTFIEDLVVFLNNVNERIHEIEPDHKIFHRPLSVLDILKLLPRTNCRICGYPSCMAFAAALSQGQTLPDNCPGFAAPISLKAVYPVLDVQGVIASTISIEIDAQADEDYKGRLSIPKKHCKSEEVQKEKTLLDHHGFQIRKKLTPRQIEVLRLVADGSSNLEISEQMGISHHTVKSHIIHIFNKISAKDRTQAAVWAVRNNII